MPLSLVDLPDDALVEVLSRVSGDLHATASTCTRLRDLCYDAADASVALAWFARGHRAAVRTHGPRPWLAPPPSRQEREHPVTRALRATPPLLAALKWRATRRLFSDDPQRLAEFCCALVGALTPTGGSRDSLRRGGGGGTIDATDASPASPRPLPCPRDGGRGPPPPACAARMGCDAPYARPFLHAALAHCRAASGRPIHALVALASALPPVLQPLVLPALVAGGHAEAALRLLDGEGCLDQPGCLGGRFDLDLGGGAGPGALLLSDAPLLPRLRACVKQACNLHLRQGEEEWWWWWLPPCAARWTSTTDPRFLARSPEEEARLTRELEASGLRCLRWALWEPVRLGDRPPPGLGPCAGGGVRRAIVAPLAMALAAAVKLVATTPRPPCTSAGSQPDANARLLWALTEATMFARIFRHHLPGPWWRRTPFLLPPLTRAPAGGQEGGEPGAEFHDAREEEAQEEQEEEEEEAQTARESSDEDEDEDEDDEDDDEDDEDDEDDGEGAPDEGAALPMQAARHPPFGQARLPATPDELRGLWRWRGRAVFAQGEGGVGGGGGGHSGSPPPSPLPPWCCVVGHLNKASHAAVWSRLAAPPVSAAADAAVDASRRVRDAVFDHVIKGSLGVRLLSADDKPSSFAPRTVSADPVGAVFGPADDPLALPALVEMAACVGGAARLREAWAAAGGARGRALFARSAQKSGHLLAALAYGGAGGGSGSDDDDDGEDDGADDGIFRRLLRTPRIGSVVIPYLVRAEGITKALCAAGEAGNEAAMRAVLAHPGANFGALALALGRACGGAFHRHWTSELAVNGPEAWHPGGAVLSPAFQAPSPSEWPEGALSLLLAALTGERYREEAAEALCPALRLCLLRRPADRERTLRAVWAALEAVPVAAEQLASRTGQRRAPNSGLGVGRGGGGEGLGEPESILALLARRGDLERIRWALGAAPTVAFRAREYPILLALERGYADVAQLLLDAPRVAEGVIERGKQLRGKKQAEARGRVFQAARAGDAPALREALGAVEIDASRNDWWSPLLAEMIASAAAAASREGPPGDEAEDYEEMARFGLHSMSMGFPGGGMFSGGAAGGAGAGARQRSTTYTIMLSVLLREASRKLAPIDAYAAMLAVALGRDFGGERPWGPPPDAEQREAARLGLRLPALMINLTRHAVSGLCAPPKPPQSPPRHGIFVGSPLTPLLVAALLADGSPRALDAVARLEEEPVRPSTRPGGLVPPAPPAFSLGLDVGLILARNCQQLTPAHHARLAGFGGHAQAVVRLSNGASIRCAGAAQGWALPTERPFPAESVLAAACRPGRALALALREAHAAAMAEAEGDDKDEAEGDKDEHEDAGASLADVALIGGPWEDQEDQDTDPTVGDPLLASVAAAGVRQWLRLHLAGLGVLAPPPWIAHTSPPFPGDARSRDPPLSSGRIPFDGCPGALHRAARPHPCGRIVQDAHLAPAIATALQARGGDALGLACAALLAHRGRRALVDAYAAWRTWGTDGGDVGEAGDDAVPGPLLRAPAGAPPLSALPDVHPASLALALRGQELAAECG